MTLPDYVALLRRHVGHATLLAPGAAAIVWDASVLPVARVHAVLCFPPPFAVQWPRLPSQSGLSYL